MTAALPKFNEPFVSRFLKAVLVAPHRLIVGRMRGDLGHRIQHSRMDRRNVDIPSYCSVGANSRFILGLHCNFDAAAYAFAINAEAASRANGTTFGSSTPIPP